MSALRAARSLLALGALSAVAAPALAGAIDGTDDLALWLDANNLDGTGASQPSGYLSTRNWRDLSGFERGASAFGASLPTVRAVDGGLASGVEFSADASQDQQLRAAWETMDGGRGGDFEHVTVFIVYEHAALTAMTDDVLVDLSVDDSSSDDFRFSVDATGQVTLLACNATVEHAVDDAVEVGTRHLWTLRWTRSGDAVIRRSGSQLASTAASCNNMSLFGQAFIGAGFDATASNLRAAGTGVNGVLHELAVFARPAAADALDAVELDLIEAALAAKWGVSLASGAFAFQGNAADNSDARMFSADLGGAGAQGATARGADDVGGLRIDASGVATSSYRLIAGHDDGSALEANPPNKGRYANRAWFARAQGSPTGNVTLTFDLAELGIDQPQFAAAGWGLSMADAGSTDPLGQALGALPSSVDDAVSPNLFYAFPGYDDAAPSSVAFTLPAGNLDGKVFTLYQPPTVTVLIPRSAVEPEDEDACGDVGVRALLSPSVGEDVMVRLTFLESTSSASADDDVGGLQRLAGDAVISITVSPGATEQGFVGFCVEGDGIYEAREQIAWDVSAEAAGFQVLLRDQDGRVAASQTTAEFTFLIADSLLPPAIGLSARPLSFGGPIPTSLSEGGRFLLGVEVLDRDRLDDPEPRRLTLSLPLEAVLTVTEATVPYCLNENSSCNSRRATFNNPTATVTIMPGNELAEVTLRAGGDRIAGPGGAITVRIHEVTGTAVTTAGGRAPTTTEERRELGVSVEDDDLATIDIFFLDPGLQVAWAAQQFAVLEGAEIVPLALEEGSADAVEVLVQLSNRPASDDPIVVTHAARTNAGRGAIEVAGEPQLRFNERNWNRPQTVSFIPVEDDFPGDSEVSLSLSVDAANTRDPVYRETAHQLSVLMRVQGNEAPELLASANPVPVEEGTSASFSVRLAARPTGSVVYLIERTPGVDWRAGVLFNLSGPAGPLMPDTQNPPLIFSDTDWNTSRTFSVASLADDSIPDNTRSEDDEGVFGVVFNPLTIESPSLDAVFSSSFTLVFQSVDNDEPSIVVIPESLSIDERGAASSATIMVRLKSVPEGETFIEVDGASFADELGLDPSPTRLRFDASNWRDFVEVVVTAVDDAVAETTELEVSFAVSVDTQSNYRIPNVVDPAIVAVSVVDDEVAAILASTRETTVAEGSTTTFSVSLAAAPASDVEVSARSSSAAVAAVVSPSTLRFTTDDYDVAQTVTVLAFDNAIIAENAVEILLLGLSADARSPYAQLSSTVSVVVDDDERAEVDVGADDAVEVDGVRRVEIVEGVDAELRFAAGALPQAPIELTLRSPADYLGFSVGGEPFADVARVELADLGAGVVVVRVDDDAVFSGLRDTLVTVRLSAPGTRFAAATVDDIAVRVVDDELAEVELCLFVGDGPCDVGEVVVDEDVAGAGIEIGLSARSATLADGVRIPVTLFSSTSSARPAVGCAPEELDAQDDCDYGLPTFAALSETGRSARLALELVDDPVYESDEGFLLGFEPGNGAVRHPNASTLDVTIDESHAIPHARLRTADPDGVILESGASADTATQLELVLSRPTFLAITATVLVTPSTDVLFLPPGLDLTIAEAGDYSIPGVGEFADDPSSQSVVLQVSTGQTVAALAVDALPDADLDNEGLVFSVLSLSSSGVAVVANASSTLVASLVITENLPLPAVPDDAGIEIPPGDIGQVSARLRWNAVTERTDVTRYRVLLYVERVDLPSQSLELAESLMPVRTLSVPVAEGQDAVEVGIDGLFPNHRYFALIAALNQLNGAAFYHQADGSTLTAFATQPAQDDDGDGLADNLVAPDGSAADSDGDGISDDAAAYLRGVYDAAGMTTLAVSVFSDGNGNGVPDLVEVALGLPADSATAQNVLGVRRVALTHAPIATVAAIGFHTAVSVARQVQVDDDDEPATLAYVELLCGDPNLQGPVRPLSVWLRRGDCEGILPADYACRCDRPPSAGGNLFLRPGRHELWWIAVDSDGNWPLGGASAQTVRVLPQIQFQPTPMIPVSRRYSLFAKLNGPLPPGDGLDVRFMLIRDFGGFADVLEDEDIEDLPVMAFAGDAGVRLGRSVVFRRAADTASREIYRLYIQDEVFVQDNSQVLPQVEKLAPGASLDTIAAVADGGIPPKIDLALRQGDSPATTVLAHDTAAAVSLEVGNARTDLARGSGVLVSYDWGFTDARLAPPAFSELRWSVDEPLQDRDRVYVVGVQADNQVTAPVVVAVPVRVMPGPVALPQMDVDADGVPGEGLGDADRDGLPDFLDALDHDAFALPMCHATLPVAADASCPAGASDATRPENGYLETDSYLVTTHPWLRLRLGVTALSVSSLDPEDGAPSGYAPLVSVADIHSHADRGSAGDDSGLPPLEAHGVFDFLVMDMPVQGELASVVLPMLAPLPERPSFVHYRPADGWSRFTFVDGAETVSVRGQPGVCPDVSASDWLGARELRQGDHCVRLTVRDGGRNDGDIGLGVPSQGAQGRSMPNAMIAFTGGVISVPHSVVVAGGNEGRGGGCAASAASAASPDALLALALGAALAAAARRRRRPASSPS